MKSLWRAFLSLLLLLPAVLLLAPFTESGSGALLRAVDRFTPLGIEYGGGSLGGLLRINRLSLPTDGMILELHDIVAELELGCLWRSAICFQQLQAGYLDIALLPDPAGEPSPEDAPGDIAPNVQNSELIDFPFAVESDAVALEATRIHWQDGEWRQGPTRLQVRISGSTVLVSSAVMQNARLELRESGGAVSDIIVLPRIDLPLDLQLGELVLEGPSWNLYGMEHQPQSMVLAGYWRNTQLELVKVSASSAALGELSLSGNIQFEGEWPLQASLDLSLAQPPLWAGLHGRQFAVSAQGSLASLAVDLASPGSPELGVMARVNVLDRLLPFNATVDIVSPTAVRVADFVELPDALTDVMLQLPLSLSASGSLSVQQFELQAALVASGLGYQPLVLSVAARQQQGKVLLEQLLLQDRAGLNELRGSGEVSLVDGLQWSLALESSGFDLPQLSEYAFGRLQGAVQAHGGVQNETWQVAIVDTDLRGDINGLPARISGFGGLGGGLLLADTDLKAQLNGAQLVLQSSGIAGQPGRFELTVDDLGRWQPGSRGKLQLQAIVAADMQLLEVSGALQDIEWQALQVDSGTITGSYHAGAEQALQLDISLDEVLLAGVELSSLHLQAKGTPRQHTLGLISKGDVLGELALAGALSADQEQWSGRLAPTSLVTPHGVWQLTDALHARWSSPQQQLSLDAHCWRQQQSRICPGELLLGAQSSGSASMVGDMALLAGLLPADVALQGNVKIELEASHNPDQGLLVQGRSQTDSLVLTRHFSDGESASIGWDKGDAVVNYDSRGLNLDWELHREGRKILDLALLLPPHKGDPLAGTVNFEQLQLGALAAFAPTLSTLGGIVSGNLKLAGTAEQPLAQGTLKLSAGRLAMVGNPTQLSDLDLMLEMQGSRAEVLGSGVLGGGALQFSGELVTQPELLLQLAIKGGEHTILYPPSTELQVSETLQLKATPGLLDLSGELVVHQGVLEFEQLPEGSVAVSADVVQVDYTGKVIDKKVPFDIAMDLRVRIEDRFEVTGNVLQTTLGGDLRVLQQARQPLQLFGNLHTLDGELRAYQQSLQIKRGKINFSGSPGNPALDVRAQRDISGSNVKVGVQVRGRLEEDMVLEVYSDPAMSKSEAMSYLVRGRGLDSGAGADGTAVAVSLAGGVVNRSTVVSELNRIPGVSNFEFGAEGSEQDTAATVSGYLGERLYLSYGYGLYEPINVLTARLYLGSRLWLEVVSRLENSVDLYYSFDID